MLPLLGLLDLLGAALGGVRSLVLLLASRGEVRGLEGPGDLLAGLVTAVCSARGFVVVVIAFLVTAL